jgi:hypothetical protein
MPDGASFRPPGYPAKNLGGRPAWQPTDEQRRLVQVLRASGNDVTTIARILGVSQPTLRRACREELCHGFADIKVRMILALTKRALGGDTQAMIYWLSLHCPEWRRARRTVGESDARPDEEPVVIIGPVPRDE